MTDLEARQAEERKELEAKHAKEAENLTREQDLRNALDEAGAPQPWICHWRQLYGIDVSFGYGDHHAEEPVTIEQAAEICKALPPIPKNYARGRYHYLIPGIRTADFLLEKEEAKGMSSDDITEYFEVAPWHVRVNHWGTEVKYFTLIGELVAEVSLKVARSSYWGAFRFSGTVKHWGQCGPVKSITGRRVTQDGRDMSFTTVDIQNEAGAYCGQFDRPIIYAQGTPDSLGDAKLWAHLSADNEMTVTDFMRALFERREVEA